jgi:HEAT repeat protein
VLKQIQRQVLGLVPLVPGAPDLPGLEDDAADDGVRMAALNALAHMDADRALPILRSVVARRDPESTKLRRQAIFLLALQDSDEAKGLILEVARHDPDVAVREQAIIHLARVSDEAALEVLTEVLRDSADVGLQERAVASLAMLDNPRADAVLREVAARVDVSRLVRERAISRLGLSSSDVNRTFLRRLFGETDDPVLKEMIVISAGEQADKETREWLFPIVRDPDQPESVREKAFFWVAFDKKVTTEKLVDLYADLDGRQLRKQAILVIGEREDEEAVDLLLEIARNETDDELRRAAIFWLGQSRDARAAELLEELIQQ